MAAKKKKKILLIAIPLVMIAAGGGVGFGIWKGLIKLPGGKKPVVAKPQPKVAIRRATPPPPPKPVFRPIVVRPAVDPVAGAAKLAKLWNEVETPKLLAMTKAWATPDLAPVTLAMEPTKVAEILAALPPARASDLSREMRRLASKVED